ncbi:putative metal ion efflux outer membrane family protein [Desulforapulum autotrophicum HRM2]|uniref:Metal ion efflux outer membrane family protein n=1 Tax=Desulforapulum autotrophicum (strain ATCC 43914 / DSM 3382 / VKM B-1955 / HRM2) TaxID=177437 RepID=C0QE54_DESAH|nr:TolC family protein [Desulforapulum autotrophicum]ACN13171.1 putative metal ion efflux outer membrane family protein [Desulforapulum autotrophicum HRM2]
MKRFILLTLFLCLGLISLSIESSSAAEKESLPDIEKRLSGDTELSDLLTYAYLSNPSIVSSKKSWQIFIENYRIGKSYPDPQLMTTYFPSPIETRLGPQDWNLTLSQAFPFPGTLGLKGELLESDVQISKLKLDKTVKDIVTAVSSSFYELVYIQKAVEIAMANQKLNQELIQISQNAYAKDRALFYDVSKAQAQTAQIQYDLLLLDELESTEKTNLNTLLNRSPDAKIGRAKGLPTGDVVYSLDEIYNLAMLHQEDILIADETVKRSSASIRLTRFENLPSFKLGLFYAGIGDPDLANPPRDAGDDALGIQFGMNLPLWFSRNDSQKQKALAVKEMATADRAAMVNTTKARISRLWFRLQNSKRLIVLYEKELIPQGLTSIQTAETWFREGEAGFADFLELQATAYNFQLSLERAKADYGKALVQLEQLAGVILDRKKNTPLGDNS